ncbi:MAG: dienelactone hydrolase family protein [Gemmatimonadales bacterium]
MSRRRSALFLCCTLSAAPLGAAAGQDRSRSASAVGFTEVIQADSSRRSVAGAPRAVEVAMWYPARGSSGRPLTYREYYRVSTPKQLDELLSMLKSRGAPDSVVERWMSAPMLAARDAAPADGRYPLVLLAQGNGETVPDLAYLAEFLASRGYVVGTTPSPTLVSGPLTDDRQIGERAEEQARDLAVAEEVAGSRADVLRGPIGVVGHSFGARAALLLAMREPGVGALVSLDGGIGTANGRRSMEALPAYRAAAVHAPILHFYERLDAFMTPDFTLLRSLSASNRWLVAAPAMHHHHFTSLGAVSVEFPALRSVLAATAETAQAYTSVMRTTMDFLDDFVKKDARARDRWSPFAASSGLGPVEALRAMSP